jgi:penicillin-binding protein 2
VIGNVVQPRVEAEDLGFSPEAFAAVRAGMDAVANQPGGTAYQWRITEPGLEMAGKTGTAQVRVISREEHNRGVTKNANLPWKLRDHALFIAFAPVAAPRYAAAIVMEHGAMTAHPHVQMVRDILRFAQQRKVLELPTAYPVRAAEAIGSAHT